MHTEHRGGAVIRTIAFHHATFDDRTNLIAQYRINGREPVFDEIGSKLVNSGIDIRYQCIEVLVREEKAVGALTESNLSAEVFGVQGGRRHRLMRKPNFFGSYIAAADVERRVLR